MLTLFLTANTPSINNNVPNQLAVVVANFVKFPSLAEVKVPAFAGFLTTAAKPPATGTPQYSALLIRLCFLSLTAIEASLIASFFKSSSLALGKSSITFEYNFEYSFS